MALTAQERRDTTTATAATVICAFCAINLSLLDWARVLLSSLVIACLANIAAPKRFNQSDKFLEAAGRRPRGRSFGGMLVIGILSLCGAIWLVTTEDGALFTLTTLTLFIIARQIDRAL